jgi:hypothetical protein
VQCIECLLVQDNYQGAAHIPRHTVSLIVWNVVNTGMPLGREQVTGMPPAIGFGINWPKSSARPEQYHGSDSNSECDAHSDSFHFI